MQANTNTSRRTGILKRGPLGLVIIAAHVLVIYIAATSMGIIKFPNVIKPMQALIIDAPEEQKSEPVKVIKPEMEQPAVDTPPIQDTIPEIEVPTDEPAPAAITADTSTALETSNMKVNKRVDPVYPPQSRRAGEEGTGVFRVLVDASGHASGVTVVKSTGFPKLDDAAMTAIRKWLFKAAVQNGQPVQSWTRVRVQFRLDNA
jgi:protein TonB